MKFILNAPNMAKNLRQIYQAPRKNQNIMVLLKEHDNKMSLKGILLYT